MKCCRGAMRRCRYISTVIISRWARPLPCGLFIIIANGSRNIVARNFAVDADSGMPNPKFSIGEKVVYTPGFSQERGSGAGVFEIIRSMPDENAGSSYKIRHVTSGQERIAREHQLEKAPGEA